MTKEFLIKAYSKINISLDVLSKRTDGYHNLRMIMHSVKDLYDEIIIKESKNEFKICSDNEFVPDNTDNIIFKAYKAFYKNSSFNEQPFEINLKKNIPVCAGLGGGSADASAVLSFLNTYHNNEFSEEELIKIGKTVGADVPFCIMGGTCLAEGIGERLTKLQPLPKCYIVIAKPNDTGLSTGRIFSKVDTFSKTLHPDTNGIIEALKNNDLNGICKRMYNVLEAYSIDECPVIEEYKTILTDNNALGALMSGSGNAVFGIYDNLKYAKQAFIKLKELTEKVFLIKNE